MAVGRELFNQLRNHPDGCVVNLSELARDLGLSRETVHRAIRYFLRFGKVLVIEERRVGDQPGRPRAYKLHPVFVDWKSIRAKRVNYNKEDRKASKPLNHTDASRPRDPNLAIKNPAGALRFAMAEVRREVAGWSVSWGRRNNILDAAATWLRETIGDGAGWTVGSWRLVVRGLIGELRQGENFGGTARAAHAFVRWAMGVVLRDIPASHLPPEATESLSGGEEQLNGGATRLAETGASVSHVESTSNRLEAAGGALLGVANAQVLQREIEEARRAWATSPPPSWKELVRQIRRASYAADREECNGNSVGNGIREEACTEVDL